MKKRANKELIIHIQTDTRLPSSAACRYSFITSAFQFPEQNNPC